MSEPTVEPSGDASVGATDPSPVTDHGGDGRSRLSEADSEGSSAGVDSDTPDTLQPESEPVDLGPSPQMIHALAGTEIPENLAEHWDHNAALKLYDEALKEGIAPEVLSKLMNSYSKGQSERLPQVMEAARERVDAQKDEAASARAASARRSLQHEWKDGYEAKVETARDVVANLLGHDELQRIVQIRLEDGSRLGDSTLLIKMFQKMGAHMALESTAELAQQDLDELEADESFTKHFYDQSNTHAHRAAVEKHQRIFDRAYPEKAPAQAEPVTGEAKAAAKDALKAYSENKNLGDELSRAMSSMDDPRDRSDGNRQVLTRWRDLNRIADAPITSRGADGRFAGKPIGESAGQISRAEARAEIDKLEKNPDLWGEPTVGAGLETHRALVARRNKLYAIAYAD